MSALTCLNDFITLRGTCNDTTPVSGKYINDLAGVDLRALSSLSNEEMTSFQGVYDEIYRRSVNELEGDVLVRMQKYFKTKILVDASNTGYFLSPTETESSSNYKKGIAIELFGSKNMQIVINSVDLYTASAVTDYIRIYDYNTGTLLDSISYTTTAGETKTIQINKSYDAFGSRKKLFITYNGNLTNSFKTTYTPYFENNSNYAVVRGASVSNSSSVLESNMSFDSNSGGLIVNFIVKCSINNFICANRDLFTMPLMYKLGEQIMLERLVSQRFNEYTTLNNEEVVKLKDYYSGKFNEIMEATLTNLTPNGDDICFECNKTRTYKYQLP